MADANATPGPPPELLVSPLGSRSPRAKRAEQAAQALALIDQAATSAALVYAFSVPLSRDDIAEALAIGRCRTTRNIRLGNTSTFNRRGELGDIIVDLQGLLPELVLLPLLRSAPGIERIAPLLEVAPADGDDLVANGTRYDIKAVGARRCGAIYATGCNINEKKRPDVFVVARIDYGALKLHVYAVKALDVFGSWRRCESGFSPYYERTMPDAARYRLERIPAWLAETIQQGGASLYEACAPACLT